MDVQKAQPSAEGFRLCDEICGHKIVTPAFSAWQGGTAKEGNFVISYSKSEENDAVAAMNYLIGNMLLALPIKRVHLNFIIFFIV